MDHADALWKVSLFAIRWLMRNMWSFLSIRIRQHLCLKQNTIKLNTIACYIFIEGYLKNIWNE